MFVTFQLTLCGPPSILVIPEWSLESQVTLATPHSSEELSFEFLSPGCGINIYHISRSCLPSRSLSSRQNN